MSTGTCNHPYGIVGYEVLEDILHDIDHQHAMLDKMSFVFLQSLLLHLGSMHNLNDMHVNVV